MSENFSDNPTLEHIRPPGPPSVAEMAPRFPQLEILDLLGAGGMGVVYKARQKSLDRIIALKVLLPQPDRHEAFAERFTREARALARLQHPNIVTVYDSGSIGELCYFMMEYVDGSNLRQMLGAHSGRLQPQEALAIVPGVCDALDYAHAEGIAHRDIKPENILIDRKGRVKIADFGIAKLLQRPGTDYTLTHTQQIIGTMHYMAPEQIERPGSVDHRADIYSLGVVLYEMMTGELPLGRFPLPSERALSDPRLDQVVLRALEKEPARRYQRASDVKTDLLRFSGPPGVPGAFAANAQSGGASAGPAVTSYTPGSQQGYVGPAWRTPPTLAVGSATPVPTPFQLPLPGERSPGIAYLCWLLCFVGFFGIHRLYAGRWITGCIWLITFGCLFVGQGVDLLIIPRMIRRANEQHRPWAPVASPSPSSAPGVGGYSAPPRRSWGRIIFLLIAIPCSIVLTVAAVSWIIKVIFAA